MADSVFNAMEEIDAAMFSGDYFLTDTARIEQLEEYIGRWQRGLKEHKSFIEELKKEEESGQA